MNCILLLFVLYSVPYVKCAKEGQSLQLPAYNREDHERICHTTPLKNAFIYVFGSDYPYNYSRSRKPIPNDDTSVPQLNAASGPEDGSRAGEGRTSSGEGSTPSGKDEDLLGYRDDMTEEEFNKLLNDIIFKYNPVHETTYNAEWGHVCLTEDGKPPITSNAIHFNIFDGFLPSGLEFTDLRVLLLYTVSNGYYLYKIKFGDMVVTLRPDLVDPSVQLFENYGKLLVVRICYFLNGIFERHEYVETKYGSKIFQKSHGRSVTPPLPKSKDGEPLTKEYINDWLKSRYKEINKTMPPIVEEIIEYNVVLTS